MLKQFLIGLAVMATFAIYVWLCSLSMLFLWIPMGIMMAVGIGGIIYPGREE